ncbi:MAG: ATP-binding protein [Deltaproteobacteria bacterium]|nr:ATP-binding protein [Deltaproteobacteria bacterium]MBN2673640.1 ATP-binding protein [Deltaproteobacteria bacterium]
MNEPLQKRISAYRELAVFLKDSIQKGLIPKKHIDAVELILEAEQSGVLQALETLRNIPDDHPLHKMYGILCESKPYVPILLSSPPNPAMTFRRYVNSSVNKLSYKLAASIVKGTSDIFFGVLFIFGDSGQGKTHLLSAIANDMNAQGNDTVLMRVADLEMELNRANQIGRVSDIHWWILNHKTVLIDDVQDVAGNFKIQKELISIIKGANARSIPVVLSANGDLAQCTNIDRQLIELISSGVTAEVTLPHREHLCVIAKNVAGNVNIPDNVVDYLADNITDNVRHLVAAVQQIIALHKQTDTPITVDMARAVAPMEHDLRSTIPLLDASRSDIYQNDIDKLSASTSGIEPQHKADIFKEMLASAQNEEEQCLALQIAVSEKIKELRKKGNHEEVAKLKTALEHLRAGDIREALSCTSL